MDSKTRAVIEEKVRLSQPVTRGELEELAADLQAVKEELATLKAATKGSST